MQEPSLPLHLQSIWEFNSDRVGLAYLAAVVPALICKSYSLTKRHLVLTRVAASPLAGFYVDQVGPQLYNIYMSAPCTTVVDCLDPTALFTAIHFCSCRSMYVYTMATCVELTFLA